MQVLTNLINRIWPKPESTFRIPLQARTDNRAAVMEIPLEGLFYYGATPQSLPHLYTAYEEKATSDFKHKKAPNEISAGVVVAGSKSEFKAFAYRDAEYDPTLEPKDIWPDWTYRGRSMNFTRVYRLQPITDIQDVTHLIVDPRDLPTNAIYEYLTK